MTEKDRRVLSTEEADKYGYWVVRDGQLYEGYSRSSDHPGVYFSYPECVIPRDAPEFEDRYKRYLASREWFAAEAKAKGYDVPPLPLLDLSTT